MTNWTVTQIAPTMLEVTDGHPSAATAFRQHRSSPK
jgi:hypothetical protein